MDIYIYDAKENATRINVSFFTKGGDYEKLNMLQREINTILKREIRITTKCTF